jgi:UDPglucose 6-dehydrogenase
MTPRSRPSTPRRSGSWKNPIEAAKGADVLVVATEWPQFAGVDLRAVRDAMAGDAIVDLRNLLDPLTVRQLGMRYTGVGR